MRAYRKGLFSGIRGLIAFEQALRVQKNEEKAFLLAFSSFFSRGKPARRLAGLLLNKYDTQGGELIRVGKIIGRIVLQVELLSMVLGLIRLNLAHKAFN